MFPNQNFNGINQKVRVCIQYSQWNMEHVLYRFSMFFISEFREMHHPLWQFAD